MNKNMIEKFFKLAKNASSFSDFHKQKMGAIIVYKHRVLSVGWNTEKTSPLQKRFNKYRNFDTNKYENSSHAEMNAIKKLLNFYKYKEIDFSKCVVFVWRENKSTGKPALAKPCIACETAIRSLGIREMYYTGNNSFIHEVFNGK